MKKTTSWDYAPENYPKQKASALVTKQNRFSLKFLMLLLLFLGVSVNGWGQTNPMPFDLSTGNFSFSSQTASSTSYPTNIQGWTTGTDNLATLTTAAPSANQALVANGTASTSGLSNLVANGFNFLSTGNSPNRQVGAIVVALNSTNRNNLKVSWLVADQTSGNTRQMNITLQYRIGTTGTFTTVSASTYTTSHNSQKALQTFTDIALPAICDNQAVVQIRWITYESASQSGARDAIRLDEISVTSTEQSSSPPTKLAITSITPTTPIAGSTFNVTVQAQDDSNNAGNVTDATAISLANTGGGTIGGTTTGTIAAGTNSVTITGVTLSSAGTGVTLTASRTNGDVLTDGTSAAFNVLATQPTAVTNTVIGTRTTNSIPLSWTNGNGAGRIVVARLNNTTRVAPTTGTVYTANSASFTDVSNSITGTGNVVVYNGTGNNVEVTGLSANTNYIFDIYDYNGTTGTINYSSVLSSTATSTLSAEPSTQASSITYSNITATGMTIGFTTGNGAGRIILVKQGNAVDAIPIDGTSYTGNLAFGSGNQIGTGNFVVRASTATGTATITNLNPNTTYHIAIFEYNGTSGTINYLTSSALIGSATTRPTPASNVSVTSRTVNSIGINWTNGNGTGRIVVARTPSAISPTDGVEYTYSSTDITDVLNSITGTGNFVVYNGTGNSVNVTGLSASTNYKFDVYEYNGAGTERIYALAGTSATSLFTLNTEPTTAASIIGFSSISATGLTINMEKGDGANRLIIAKANSAVDANPVDGESYNAAAFGSGTQIGSGNYVVYSGTAANANITGLNANTTYHFAVYEFNGSGTTINYLTTNTPNANQITLVAAPTAPTNLNFSTVTQSSYNISFTASSGSPTGYLVMRRMGAALTGNPVGGTVYEAGQSVGAAANQIIYVGSDALSNFAQTNLVDNTIYYYAIYAYSGSGTQTNYSTALTGSQITATTSAPTANEETTISSTGFTANWDAVNGTSGYKLDVSALNNFAITNLSESFDGLTAGTISLPDGTDISSSLNSYLQTTGWTGTSVFQSGGSAKLGSSNSAGSIITRTIDLSANFGNATLTFDLLQFGSDATVVQAFHAADGTNFSQVGSDITAPSVSTTQTLAITGGTSNSKIKIAAKSSSKNRFHIDNFNVQQNICLSSYDNLSVSSTSKEVTGLTPNTTYYYRVRAVGGNSTSANSNVVTVLTLPAAPVASEASTVNALNFVANWTLPGTGADSYTLDVATDEDFNNKLEAYDNLTVTGTSQAISGLSRNTTYYYRVKSVNASGASVSNVISVSTGNAITVTGSNESAGSLADCADCDLVVNQGGHLTVNANKSFNSVTIKPGAKLTLNDGQTFAPGTFVLESDASGTATFVDKRSNANKTNITATVKRHLPSAADRTWWYLASPVTGAASSVFGSNKVGDYSETTRSYSNPFAAPTTLTVGKGYVVKMTAESAANYLFENRTLNTGDISVALTRTVTQTPDNAKRGFNLVGNPYPSYLNWELAYNNSTNVRSTIWYRTLNGASMEFHTYNATLNASVPSSASGYIPPMQAFWVKVDKDPTVGSVSNGILNFTNDMRSHDESALGNPLKAPAADRNLVRLSISNGTLSDETVIATHPSASDSYDRFDSEKMANGDANRPEIFSLAGNQELVINGISPLTDSKQIALGVRPGRAGNYTISLTEWRNTGNLEAVLRDNQLGEELILTESSSYSFDTDGNASTSRFSLLFRAKGSTTGFDRISSDLMIYSTQNTIRVESASLEGNAISIFNALGQPVFNGKAQSNRLEINGLTPAVYMVKVNNQRKMVIVK